MVSLKIIFFDKNIEPKQLQKLNVLHIKKGQVECLNFLKV